MEGCDSENEDCEDVTRDSSEEGDELQLAVSESNKERLKSLDC